MTAANLKTGTKAFFVGFDFAGEETREAVTIAPVRKVMLPMPDGYVPVRFADGGVVLAHSSRLVGA